MPLVELSDGELATGAMAARGAAALAEKDAAAQTSPSLRATFEESQQRYRDLADKFERARLDPVPQFATLESKGT